MLGVNDGKIFPVLASNSPRAAAMRSWAAWILMLRALILDAPTHCEYCRFIVLITIWPGVPGRMAAACASGASATTRTTSIIPPRSGGCPDRSGCRRSSADVTGAERSA
jgi:hypothetical protein